MSIDESVRITPDNCISLRNTLDLGDPVQKQDYDFIEANVRMYLSSQLPWKCNRALENLRKFFSSHAEIHTVDDENTTWAYLSLTQKREVFLLVETYEKNSVHLELVPQE